MTDVVVTIAMKETESIMSKTKNASQTLKKQICESYNNSVKVCSSCLQSVSILIANYRKMKPKDRDK